MRHARLPHADRTQRPRTRGFTIVELLTSIFVIGLILAILIVGLRFFFAAGQATRQRASVTQMKQAVSDFKTKFGFLPPLVRDQYIQPTPPPPPILPLLDRRSTEDPATSTSPGQNRIAVVDDMHLGPWIPDTVANNPYADPRFSVRTLPYYLMGALEVKYLVVDGPGGNVAIDGVDGPGSYRPDADGTFRVPGEVLRAIQSSGNPNGPRKLTAEVYLPSIDAGSSDPKLVAGADVAPPPAPVYDAPLDTADSVKLQVKDSKGVPYRYYRWSVIVPPPPPAVPPKPIVNQNIPLMVGNASDPSVRGASYAIVGAGPNHVFGDEDIAFIRTALGKSLNYPEAAARQEAAADNIVEVGQ